MTQSTCVLIGAPVDSGKQRKGCLMGPDAYRVAGLGAALSDLGHHVVDKGNLRAKDIQDAKGPEHLVDVAESVGWTEAIADAAKEAFDLGHPVFLGGDHALSLGSGLAATRYAAEQSRPLFVLWLDAHSDFHTPYTTQSGNLHGTPLAYLTGRAGFDAFPEMTSPVPDENVCIANGLLHVSLDVDFLDPMIAPAVGTTVPGGATMREAHLVMEILSDSGLMTTLDLVELNPFLDDRGRTAQIMVDLAASAFGRRVFDRPTHSFSLELPR